MKVEIPRPIVKWAGGKRWSVPHILGALPKQIDTYHEPFVGGGSVFFALARGGRFRRAVISDSNEELIECYRTLRDDFEGVERAIRGLYPGRITQEKYDRVKQSRPRTAPGRAARTLFLNKCGFNGLYRVNRAGKFNVPWGRRSRWVPDLSNLQAVSLLLRGELEVVRSDGESVYPEVSIHCRDFGAGSKQLELFEGMGAGDACYFDPPYLAESVTARFVGYTRSGFSLDDHRRLAALFTELASKGVHVVASNADVRGTMRLYGDDESTEFYRLMCPRAVNSRGDRRWKIGELMMVNPGKPGEVRQDVQE